MTVLPIRAVGTRRGALLSGSHRLGTAELPGSPCAVTDALKSCHRKYFTYISDLHLIVRIGSEYHRVSIRLNCGQP